MKFAELVRAAPGEGRILEIGPFAYPLLRGPDVAYADVLTTRQIKERAREVGINAQDSPDIDFVVTPADLSTIAERFRAVVSCHAIEHQPNFIGHLRQVASLLRPGGRYFLVVPDRRYGADHYLPSSTLSDIVAADAERRSAHTLRSYIEHRVLTVHNDPRRHWDGDHGAKFDDFAGRLARAVSEFETGTFVDLHAWQFDPASFREVMFDLASQRQVPFQVEAIYPTRHDDGEFFVILGPVAGD